MEGVMPPEQLEQLTARAFEAIAVKMERRLDEWWQNRPTAGKGGSGK